MARINGLVHYASEVRTGTNWEDKQVVQLRFSVNNYTSTVSVDRATAARLINQLRRALDANEEM